MNSRDYKTFRAGYFYHVYNRGNNKGLIFCCESDYRAFLIRLKIAIGQNVSKGIFDKQRVRITSFGPKDFTILAYCLMPNHYHFLIRQNTDIGIDKLIHRVVTSYAKYYNTKHERVGNLFQDAFKAKIVDTDSYLTYVSAYIHNNPVEPLVYAYSSFFDYIGKRNGTICDTSFLLKNFNSSKENYRTFVANFNNKEQAKIKQYLFEEG